MAKQESVGDRIRAQRERRGWTQVELGEQAGLDHSAVCQFERGLRMPSPMNLIRLADALKVTIDYLLGRKAK